MELVTRKVILGARDTENGFHELIIRELFFKVLQHRKWLLRVCQTENGLYKLATQKIFFSCLRHEMIFTSLLYGKWFYGLATQKIVSGACQKENGF